MPYKAKKVNGINNKQIRKLNTLKSAKLPLLFVVIIVLCLAILAGFILTSTVLGRAMDKAKVMIRLTVCKKELQALSNALHSYSNSFNGRYPDVNCWCDLLIRYEGIDKKSFGRFSAKGCSNYAINPDAEPNSPPDVVLLFETDGLWNQSGRAELLTFGNKEPPGCMILFNDGQVKLVKPQDMNGLKWD